jgi:hypothetical protein
MALSENIFFYLLGCGWKLIECGIPKNENDSISPRPATTQEDKLIAILQMIRILSRLDETAVYIGDADGLVFILAVMRELPSSIQLQINCSACLANLAVIGF